jgi:hypothetical protein
VFLTDGTFGMTNWIEVLASAAGHRGRPLRQKLAMAEGQSWQNEVVMLPLMRQRIRLIAGVWLGWTIAGLFYIIQETVPRPYRDVAVPWKYAFVGSMTGMYVWAALTPALFALLWCRPVALVFASLQTTQPRTRINLCTKEPISKKHSTRGLPFTERWPRVASTITRSQH